MLYYLLLGKNFTGQTLNHPFSIMQQAFYVSKNKHRLCINAKEISPTTNTTAAPIWSNQAS
jgi:hypothetical protein